MNKHIIGIVTLVSITIFYNSCTGNTDVKAPEVIDIITPAPDSIPPNLGNGSIQQAKNDSIARLTDSLVRNIRSEYNHIVKNKESYKKVVLYTDNSEYYEITYNDDGSIESVPERDIEEAISYYFDKNNQIRLIEHYYFFSHHFHFNAKLTSYYLKDGNPFFIYEQTKERPYGFEIVGDEEERFITVTEKRIYTTGDIGYDYLHSEKDADGNTVRHISIHKCVRYLFKSVEGKWADINELLQKTANTEINCFDSKEDIPYAVKNLLDKYYEPSEMDRISKEPITMHYYDDMFEQ